MGATRHEKSFVDYDKAYEQNVIGLKGIVYFAIGLLLLIVITFALMAALLSVLRDQAAESANPTHPLAPSETERLPPEPRLQAAPGFGVESEQGRVNLELRAPQSEFRELHKQWQELWAEGERHPVTGTAIILPIEEAKQKVLQENLKANNDPASAELLIDSRMYISGSSAGRLATIKRR
jgi:hypothetical protein